MGKGARGAWVLCKTLIFGKPAVNSIIRYNQMKNTTKDISAFAKLLKSAWRQDDGEIYSNRLRRAGGDCSVYTYRPDSQGYSDTLTGEEAFDLHRAKAFGRLSAINSGGILCVNEHAVHAAYILLSDMHSAWEAYQQRLEAIGKLPSPYTGHPAGTAESLAVWDAIREADELAKSAPPIAPNLAAGQATQLPRQNSR